ncbi:TPA: hypothetical protein MJD55_26810 [Klebsiella pneumoniae]|nr:hypothetical protein [Klebsiella pneumoniae]HBZ1109518.1 hypothetical protein [Klebsiella pneumoniae]
MLVRRGEAFCKASLWGRELPQPRGTLERCASDVETTNIIKDWHSRVNISFRKRGIPTSV